jgi:putative transposase
VIDDAISELALLVGVREACAAAGRPQANHYRRHRQSPVPERPKRERKPQPRALNAAERTQVRAVLNSPEHVAAGPNSVWSWDITKLRGPAKWTYFYLYVIIDIYSRYVVGWLLAESESAALAEKLLADTITKQGIDRDRLTVHADNGSSMVSKPVAFLLADLGVTKTHSRPHTSNDNPYSEAQFKTLKYRPDFPDTFGSLADARAFCQHFFTWYNTDHYHSGIGYHHPIDVHYGRSDTVRDARVDVLTAAYARNPERFVRKHPEPPALPAANLPQKS